MIPPDIQLNFTFEQLVTALHQALKHPNKSDITDLLRNLLIFRRYSQEQPSSISNQQVVRRLIEDAMEMLVRQDEELAKVLKMRFIEQESVIAVTRKRSESQSTIYRKQQEALERLAQIVQTQEVEARSEVIRKYQLRIKFPVVENLVGVKTHLKTLLNLLNTPDGPSFILLEGMGGIGKTSLAAALLAQAMGNGKFTGYGWVSAQQRRLTTFGALQSVNQASLKAEMILSELCSQFLPESNRPYPFLAEKAQVALAKYFQQSPSLIVIDNLETIDDVLDLLPTLQAFRNHARFVMTSRHSIKSEYTVYGYPVPLLQEMDALKLIRWEAAQRNLPTIYQASDVVLRPIYALVGGNPLALRLVTAQLQTYDLTVVLENLATARSKAAEALYTYLYDYIWDKLDEQTAHLWLAMRFVPEQGETLERLTQITQFDTKTIVNGLETLVTFNLVNRLQTQSGSQYAIHPLTRAFLHYKSSAGLH